MSFEARDSALVSKSWFDRKSSHSGERINMSWLGDGAFRRSRYLDKALGQRFKSDFPERKESGLFG